MHTYKSLAAELGTSEATLHGIASQGLFHFQPIDDRVKPHQFSDAEVQRFKDWWDRNSFYRTSANPPSGPAVDFNGMLEYLGVNRTMPFYYRRRFGKLYPDYMAPAPNGGRPVAMYLLSSLEAFQEWVAAGKPELPISEVVYGDGVEYDAVVKFSDGVSVLIQNGRAHCTDKGLTESKAAEYARDATERTKRKLLTIRRKSARES